MPPIRRPAPENKKRRDAAEQRRLSPQKRPVCSGSTRRVLGVMVAEKAIVDGVIQRVPEVPVRHGARPLELHVVEHQGGVDEGTRRGAWHCVTTHAACRPVMTEGKTNGERQTKMYRGDMSLPLPRSCSCSCSLAVTSTPSPPSGGRWVEGTRSIDFPLSCPFRGTRL